MAQHCSVCNSQNYHILINPKKDYAKTMGDKENGGLNKYCSQCQTHTKHLLKKIPKAN